MKYSALLNSTPAAATRDTMLQFKVKCKVKPTAAASYTRLYRKYSHIDESLRRLSACRSPAIKSWTFHALTVVRVPLLYPCSVFFFDSCSINSTQLHLTHAVLRQSICSFPPSLTLPPFPYRMSIVRNSLMKTSAELSSKCFFKSSHRRRRGISTSRT